MDGVLVDLFPTWMQRYRERTGDKKDYGPPAAYYLEKQVQYPASLMDVLDEDGFFSSLPPMKGSHVFGAFYRDPGLEVLLVTQAPDHGRYAAADKRRWVRAQYPDFNVKNIVITARKDVVSGDILLDDHPVHLESWKQANPGGTTVVYDQPYNQSYKADHRIKTLLELWSVIR